jgi:hypothetical protein
MRYLNIQRLLISLGSRCAKNYYYKVARAMGLENVFIVLDEGELW